jgi:hypothetical protein
VAAVLKFEKNTGRGLPTVKKTYVLLLLYDVRIGYDEWISNRKSSNLAITWSMHIYLHSN